MQPDLSLYMPPPTPNDLMKKQVPFNDKVKKYSSLTHHAGGLVGVPLVSAIAHAYVIAREEREEEVREKKEEVRRKEEEAKEAGEAAGGAGGLDEQTNTSLTSSSSSTRDDDGIELESVAVGGHDGQTHDVLLPVAEPVDGSAAASLDSASDSTAAASHHGHQPSILDRLKNMLHIHTDKPAEKDAAAAEVARLEEGGREDEAAQQQQSLVAQIAAVDSTDGCVLRLGDGEDAGGDYKEGDSKLGESVTRLSADDDDVQLLVANEEEQLRQLEEIDDGDGI